MRSKEEAHDYRYFPEPDLVPVQLDDAWIERIRETLPELPAQRQARLMSEHGLPEYDASQIVSTKAMAEYFDEAVKTAKDSKAVSNWLLGDVSAYMNNEGITIADFKVTPAHLAELVNLIKDGVLSSKLAKRYLPKCSKRTKLRRLSLRSSVWSRLVMKALSLSWLKKPSLRTRNPLLTTRPVRIRLSASSLVRL